MARKAPTLSGGQYKAEKNSDGTWNIHNVPIFAEIEKGTKGAPRNITNRDLKAAVQAHAAKFAEDQYLARTNVLHNYGVHRPTPAGFFLPKEVRQFRRDGKDAATVFADLLNVPDEIKSRIDALELPYCSVEIQSWEPLLFGALALLDTEPPHFKFPLITTDMESEFAASVATREEEMPVALAQFRFSDFPQEKKKDGDGDGKSGESESDSEAAKGSDSDSPPAGMADIGSKVAEAAALLQSILEPLMHIKSMVESIGGSGANPAAGAPQHGSPAVPPARHQNDGPVNQPVSAMSQNSEAHMSEAQFAGRIAALEDRVRAAETKEAIDALFRGAVKRLEGKGYAVSEALENSLRQFAEQGETPLNLFLDSYEAHGLRDPSSRFSEQAGAPEPFPAEVMKFAEQGPEAFADAQTAYRDWKELKAHKHFGSTVSPLDVYLEREVG